MTSSLISVIAVTFNCHSLKSANELLEMYRRCGFRYEKKLRATGVARIAGIDEAGRGALAGPVVAAAVVLPEKFRHRRLNDSKQLAPELREEIYSELVSNPEVRWTVGIIDSIRDRSHQHSAREPSSDARGDHSPNRSAGARLDRWIARHSFPGSADSDHRRGLHQSEHRCRQRDRQGNARPDDA